MTHLNGKILASKGRVVLTQYCASDGVVSIQRAADSRQVVNPDIRLPGLDAVRLIAMGFVSVHHILAVCTISSPSIYRHLDIGQIGVAMFFSISGFLSTQTKKSSIAWLSDRLVRVYVPYWLTVALLLSANYFVEYKPVSPQLILSEFIGLAGWTHRGEMIGVHLWFVSVLLFCYAVSALVRAFTFLLPLFTFLTMWWFLYDGSYAGHVLAFITGVWLGREPSKRFVATATITTFIAAVLALFAHNAYACSAVASLTLLWAVAGRSISPRVANSLRKGSNVSYHFYLLHAPVYLAVDRFVAHSFPIVLFVGTLASVGSAEMLRRAESRFLVLIHRLRT